MEGKGCMCVNLAQCGKLLRSVSGRTNFSRTFEQKEGFRLAMARFPLEPQEAWQNEHSFQARTPICHIGPSLRAWKGGGSTGGGLVTLSGIVPCDSDTDSNHAMRAAHET